MLSKKNMSLLGTLVAAFFVLSTGVEAWAGGTISGSVSAMQAKLKKDCVVYVDNAPGQWPPTQGAAINQKGLVFYPLVLPVVVGTTVNFLNEDNVLHNVFSPSDVAEKFNLGTWPPGEIKTYTFAKVGCAPLLCNVHTEMEGYVVVAPNPFFALTDAEGKYTIKDVPPGTYTLKVWNKKLQSDPQKVEVKEGANVQANFTLKK
ncbi:MAG TPA: carboxypeptidase regulatory-like domain-containing protein [Candidatus Tripitaka californicus]|uniref:carboxypeptidase regulatory-like domain-containing protein n=1 Tax=Candidatus Tripitaka californicus TaxID=3367616 RepID=UPI0040295BFE